MTNLTLLGWRYRGLAAKGPPAPEVMMPQGGESGLFKILPNVCADTPTDIGQGRRIHDRVGTR